MLKVLWKADWTHIAFVTTLLAKGFLGLTQLFIAAFIWSGLVQRLPEYATWFFREELIENPTDFAAGLVLKWVGVLPATDLSFYQIYFAAHGVLHVAVVVALLVGFRWAYAIAILVLGVFVVYQITEWFAVGGPMLLVLTAIDVAVIWLTLLEWRHRHVMGELY